MILDCQHIDKAFGTEELFHNVSFHLEKNDKAALIGANGCGKTTLLKIIVGEIPSDAGQVILANNIRMDYLAQNQEIAEQSSVYDYVLEAKKDLQEMEEKMRELEKSIPLSSGTKQEKQMEQYSLLTHRFELENGYAWRSEITGVLIGLGFREADFSRPLSTLSGGQKTRVALGKALLTKPDLLLLDEPTNHLDMDSISWLETYLLNYAGAVLIVSHDRYFLDRIVNKVIEIENHTAVSFPGNYTQFSEKKALVRKAQYSAWLKQQQEIHHQEAVITKLKSFNREKSIKRAESREKALDKIERVEKPQELNANMHLQLTPGVESGKDVLTVEGLSKSFGTLHLVDNQSFCVQRGERVALIGNNGTGKTTILKMITGLETADGGTITPGSRVCIGYYDQEHQVLDRDKTIFEEISDTYPDMTETQIRNVCAAFLFTGDAVFTKISALSGGERGRVSLAKLMLSKANFLLLDEPTNHLDIYSREVLEDALCAYTGTVLFVSHDRYFINRVATRILELKEHVLIPYPGNYDYYLEKREAMADVYLHTAQETAGPADAQSSALSDWKTQKEEQAAKRKQENAIRKAEEKIDILETRISRLNDEISLPENANDHVRLLALTEELQETQKELDGWYEKWEALSS